MLASVDGEAFAAVSLSGGPGIGKSRLLAELCDRARRRAWLVVSGRGAELERDLPFGVFVDALDEHLAAGPQALQRVREEYASELAAVFPSLKALSTAGAPLLADERYRAHRAVRALLEHLADEQPLLLVLDDLHWADRSSIELLDSLFRRPPRARVLIAVALRPQPADERLVAALAHAEREDALTRIALGPLQPDEARTLLGRGVGAAVARTLLHEAGGNPFYVEQLARAAPSRAAVQATANGHETVGEVPAAVAAALADELRSLGPAAHELLQAAAVAGDPFDVEFAAAASGRAERETLDALDELLRFELIRPTDVLRRFSFRHPIVRRAVYELIPAGRRLAAHERCADALRAAGADPGALAHHVEHYARSGDATAIGLLSQAADAAAARAPASAARWYAAALRLVGHDVAAMPQRAAMLGRLAAALLGTGRLAEARETMLELLALLPSAAGEQRVRLIAGCAGIEHMLGHHEAAQARLTGAFAAVDDDCSQEAVELMLALADGGAYVMDLEQMRLWATRACRAADELGDRALAAAGVAIAAFGNGMHGEEDRGVTADAAACMDALSDEELARHLVIAQNVGFGELFCDRYASAVRHTTRGLALARASGQGERIVTLLVSQASALTMLGRLDDATRASNAGVDAARLAGYPQILSWALLTVTWVQTYRGDIDAAIEAGREALSQGRASGQAATHSAAAVQLAMALVEAGEMAQARQLLLDDSGHPASFRFFESWCYLALVRCDLALGDLDAARRWAAAADALAARASTSRTRMRAAHARAALALAAGQPRLAAEQAREAAAAASQIDARIDAARAHTLAGQALAAAGDHAAAAGELQIAAAQLDACGAHRYRDEAERQLRRLGRRFVRSNGSPSDRVASLSRREREVVELVAATMTNREIAGRLYLSEKTVETHLRHIFGKLGVTSRASVARVIATADANAR